MHVPIKGQQKESQWLGNSGVLDCVNTKVLRYFTTVLQDVTFAGNWVKGKWDFSELCLIIACESTSISKLKFSLLKG